MTKKTKWFLFFNVIFVTLIGLASVGPIMSMVEKPAYSVEKQWGDVQLRAYPPLIVAEVTFDGDRQKVMNPAFRKLASYIFATKRGGEKIAMTAPVMQQKNEDSWLIRFVMPTSYTKDILPVPADTEVRLVQEPAKKMLAIRFSGHWKNHENFKENTRLLEGVLKEQGFTPRNAPVHAYYNPPWTLPFLRRNEVLWEIK